VDVVKGEDVLVLIDLPRRNLARDDLAEKAVRIVHGKNVRTKLAVNNSLSTAHHR
jgi:hypothetical protein